MKTSLYSLRWSLTFPPPSVRFQGCRACIHVRARMYTRVHTCILSLFSKPLFNTHIDSVTSCGLGARSSLSTPELSVVPPPPRPGLFLCSHPSPNPSHHPSAQLSCPDFHGPHSGRSSTWVPLLPSNDFTLRVSSKARNSSTCHFPNICEQAWWETGRGLAGAGNGGPASPRHSILAAT